NSSSTSLFYRGCEAKYTKAKERLFKLYHHRFIDRIQVNNDIGYLLLIKGRDAIAKHRSIDPKALEIDWTSDANRRSDQHWMHLLGNNAVRLRIYIGIKKLQSLYLLNQAPVTPEIRETAKQLIEVGWSRSRVWEKINFLLYTRQILKEDIADPATWLKQAVKTNKRKPKGFALQEFVSPFSSLKDAEEGFVLRNWLTDRDLSRLKADEKLKVWYTPPNGRQPRSGIVELDDEFEIVTPWQDKGACKHFIVMGEYDNMTRTLELSIPSKLDADDPSFANKMAKCVAMLNDGVYTKIRGRKLDKIFIVVNGGPRAVENRLEIIRKCGGHNAFFITSLEVLQKLENEADILIAPIWRKAGDTAENYYPLIGTSWMERVERYLKQQKTSKNIISIEITAIRQEAKRRFRQVALLELTKAQLKRVTQVKRQGQKHADKLLRNFYTQKLGQTYSQTLAIFADKVAQKRYEQLQEGHKKAR
ncbi:MAG: hypothetical protein AAF485_28590, partial [Chloroflexota bacterium]